MLGLFKAIRDYDPAREASFPTFAALCVSRQIYTAVQADGRSKHLPLNMAVSLDAAAGGTGGADGADGSRVRAALGEMISGPDTDNPEQRVIDRENVQLMFNKIEKDLSPMEQEVLGLHLHAHQRQQRRSDGACGSRHPCYAASWPRLGAGGDECA